MARRYAILFYGLLLTLIVMPIATTVHLPTVVIKILLGSCLFAAIMPSSTRRNRWLLSTAVIFLLSGRLAAEAGNLPVNPALVLVLVGVTGIAAAAAALRFTITSKVVNSEALYAALSTYLLAGVFFGQIYWSIEGIEPGSLVGPDSFTEQAAIYYSFVTLATLGYGDILPHSDITRGVATFEVIAGQLFLVVMVARLIGAFERKQQDV